MTSFTMSRRSRRNKVQYLGDPITVGGVANVNSLNVFDAVYTTVRCKPFAARLAVRKGSDCCQ